MVRLKFVVALVISMLISGGLIQGQEIDEGKWKKKIKIVIDNPSTKDIKNYQILIRFNAREKIQNGEIKEDGGDIRFATDEGKLLNYWIESRRMTSSAKVWVKVNYIPAKSSKVIYLYHGNPDAKSLSNFDSVFTKDPDAPEDLDLIAEYHFDEGKGDITYDDTENENHGVIDGATWVKKDGGCWRNRKDVRFSSGSCLKFDGVNDKVKIFSNLFKNNPDYYKNGSIEFWIKPDATTKVMDVIQYDACKPLIYFAGNLNLQVYWGGNAYSKITQLPPGRWSHVVITWKTPAVKIYVNGKLCVECDSGTGPKMDKPITIIGGPRPFAGYLDEIRVYKRDLRPEEVKSHFERRKFVFPEPKVTIVGG